MSGLSSILVVLDRKAAYRPVLDKALLLAGHCGATIELFSCDAECAYSLKHSYCDRGIEHAREQSLADERGFLESVRMSLQETRIPVSVHAACESPLYQAIVDRVLESGPDLVMKTAGGFHLGGRHTIMDANDWQLLRTCPVPVLLDRGLRWQSHPQIAAAVDLSREGHSGLVDSVMELSSCMALALSGELHPVFSSPDAAPPGNVPSGSPVHVIRGRPEETLPAYVSRYACDLLVLGALAHGHSETPRLGTLTRSLLEATGCDVVLVKPNEDPSDGTRASLQG